MKIAQQQEMKIHLPFKLLLTIHAELDPLAEFRENDEVKDQGAGKQRILTGVVDHDGVVSAHQDLTRVLIHRTLAVSDVRNVLDHYAVVGVFAGRVQQRV